MSKFVKLPDNLKAWKINSLVSSENGNELYKISKKDSDGSVINAYLRHICTYGESYNDEQIKILEDEVKFLNNISQSGDMFNYIEVVSNNDAEKEKFDIYIISEELQTLADALSAKSFSEEEIIDFGIEISSALEFLESKNIFHGNICPDNIFITKDGKYKIGGFSDFESKITDMSFTAPEIYNKKPADFTTDIYSLGIILYYMCNDKKLPFENDNCDKKSAINERLSGNSVYAPVNGNEKLKSVIVIACQPENENRWKNAGNIKNALISIKDEISKTVNTVPSPAVIPAETTDFDGNVFEEYDYSDSDEASDSGNTDIEAIKETNNKTEIKNESLNDDSKKDYGDYFNEDFAADSSEKELNLPQKNEESASSEITYAEDYEDENKKKNVLIIVSVIVLIIAALGFTAFCIINGLKGSTEKATAATEQSTIVETSSTPATTHSATAKPTSQPTTASPSKKTVVQVVGYGYNYAKELLEKEGFVVEIGEYKYSTLYDEGYVISQTPDGNTAAEKGSVVKLNISLGVEQIETTAEHKTEATENNENNQSATSLQKTDNSYIFANSDSSYLSKNQISSLSKENLSIALNEIYARRGRIFADSSLSAYFNSKSWYTPKYTAEEFSRNVTFNQYEQANLQLMVDEQKNRGYR